MALQTQTISTQEIKPIFCWDIDPTQPLGTAHEDGHNGFVDFGILSYTIPYNSASLEVSPNLSGHYGQMESQGRHRADLSTWTFDTTFLGTTTALKANCLWAFGDGASPMVLNANTGIGNGTTSAMQMLHGVASNNHATVVFQNGGTDATEDDMIVKGAMIQSMTLKQDVAANAGQLTIDSTFFTAYPPLEDAISGADARAIDTVDAGVAPKSIFALTNGAVYLNAKDLMPLSWEITISRTLERVGTQDYSVHSPYAIAQTGPWEVTGSLVVKADDYSYDCIAELKGNSAGTNISLGDGGFDIDIPDAMVDSATLDNSGTFLTHTIPFRAFAASSTANIISITPA